MFNTIWLFIYYFFLSRAPEVLKDLAPGSQPPFLIYNGEVRTDTNKIEEFLEETLAPPQWVYILTTSPKISSILFVKCATKICKNSWKKMYLTFFLTKCHNLFHYKFNPFMTWNIKIKNHPVNICTIFCIAAIPSYAAAIRSLTRLEMISFTNSRLTLKILILDSMTVRVTLLRSILASEQWSLYLIRRQWTSEIGFKA